MTFCLLSLYLTETKCKIRFIYVGFNCKRKKWGKKMSGNLCHQGGWGVGPVMANVILNFHFDYWHPSLIQSTSTSTWSHIPITKFAAHRCPCVIIQSTKSTWPAKSGSKVRNWAPILVAQKTSFMGKQHLVGAVNTSISASLQCLMQNHDRSPGSFYAAMQCPNKQHIFSIKGLHMR